MRYSNLFGKTLRDKPRNADSVSHQLLVRGGFVRAMAGGAAFGLLPLGERVLARIRAVVDAELSALGAQALTVPGGRKSGSSESSRDLGLRRRELDQSYPFADVHESVLGMLAGGLTMSYRDLPLLLTTERWGTRDQARPNWGLLSAPEFLVHGSYLFSRDERPALLDQIQDAYRRALRRLGVDASVLESAWPELVVTTALGGREALVCNACGYLAPLDEAVSRVPEWMQNPEPGVVESVYGPGLINVEPLADFLGIPVHQTTKTLVFQADDRLIAACVAGPYDVSEPKLARILGCRHLDLASFDVVRELTSSEVGYAGPIGLPMIVELFWDQSTAGRTNFEAGANRTHHHLINLNFGRDLPGPEIFYDFRVCKEGERCARCETGVLEQRRVLSMGHVSALGTAYSSPLGATFLEPGKPAQALALGVGGLDLTAVMAAIAEQWNDARGLTWPASAAPFDAHLISLPPAEVAAGELYGTLRRAGVEVLWDDRTESAGVKFGDADLIGCPVRLVLSKRTGDKVEWKLRGDEHGELINADEAMERLAPRTRAAAVLA